MVFHFHKIAWRALCGLHWKYYWSSGSEAFLPCCLFHLASKYIWASSLIWCYCFQICVSCWRSETLTETSCAICWLFERRIQGWTLPKGCRLDVENVSRIPLCLPLFLRKHNHSFWFLHVPKQILLEKADKEIVSKPVACFIPLLF